MEEAPCLSQTSLWMRMQALMDMHNSLAVSSGRSYTANHADLVFTIICTVGTGDKADRTRSSRAAKFCLHFLPDSKLKSSLDRVCDDLETACQSLNELSRSLLVPQMQDGRADDIAHKVDDMIGVLLSAVHQADVAAGKIERLSCTKASSRSRTDAHLAWRSRLASLSMRHAFRSDSAVQCRAILILSRLEPVSKSMYQRNFVVETYHQSQRILQALLLNLSVTLKNNVNAATLQAYLVCFHRHIPTCRDSSTAASVFWLAVFTGQAHPILLPPSLKIMLAAGTSIAAHISIDGGHTLQSFLMAARSRNPLLVQISMALDTSIEVNFTDATFSFAIGAIIAKTLHERHLQADGIGKSSPVLLKYIMLISRPALLKLFAMQSHFKASGEDNGAGDRATATLGSFGYLLLLQAAVDIPTAQVALADLASIAGLPPPELETTYLPVLADPDIHENVGLIPTTILLC